MPHPFQVAPLAPEFALELPVDPEKVYYVYVIRWIEGGNKVVYVGKGKGQRMLSDKNDWFDLFDDHLQFEREEVKSGLTEAEAFDKEWELINFYDQPIFNLVRGRCPQTAIPMTSETIDSILSAAKARTYGKNSPTPMQHALQLVRHSDPQSHKHVLLCGDRFGHALMALLVTQSTATKIDLLYNGCEDSEVAIIKAKRGGERINLLGQNFLTSEGIGSYDLIIMNPPFDKNEWVKFIAKARELLTPNGKLYTIIPMHKSSGLVDETIIPEIDFRNTKMIQKGKAVLITKDAAALAKPIWDKKLVIPGLQTKSRCTKEQIAAYDGSPSIMLPQFTNPQDWLNCCEIVTQYDAAKHMSGFTQIYGEAASLAKLLNCLEQGGMQHLISRYSPIYKDKMRAHAFTSCSVQQQVTWINEALKSMGYVTD
jgi:tRNA1(Val) A37 N6-methylase TrmN6